MLMDKNVEDGSFYGLVLLSKSLASKKKIGDSLVKKTIREMAGIGPGILRGFIIAFTDDMETVDVILKQTIKKPKLEHVGCRCVRVLKPLSEKEKKDNLEAYLLVIEKSNIPIQSKQKALKDALELDYAKGKIELEKLRKRLLEEREKLTEKLSKDNQKAREIWKKIISGDIGEENLERLSNISGETHRRLFIVDKLLGEYGNENLLIKI
ncbi:hypothetical protein KJ780_04895 [Candidatus Micrarchaeota archaeon]|nr:hypothetical protein [Candidatus Micrarchaeota archaeon]